MDYGTQQTVGGRKSLSGKLMVRLADWNMLIDGSKRAMCGIFETFKRIVKIPIVAFQEIEAYRLL